MKDSSQIAFERKTFVFVHSWQNKLAEDSITFDGHPVVGRVYPASINNDGLVKILLPEGVGAGYSGIAVGGLQDDNYRWSYQLEEITPSNLLKINISSEDLRSLVRHAEGEEHPMEKYTKKVKEAPLPEEEEDRLTPFSPTKLDKALMDYIPEDDIMTDTLAELIVFMSDQYEDGKMADIIAGTFNLLAMDSDKATSAMLFNAITSITEYYKSVQSGNEDKFVLLKAISYLLIELTQRKTNRNGNNYNQDDESPV